MPKYKLLYFNLRARGEIIRMLFAAAGVPYEDYRVPIENLIPGEEWTELKKKTQFGHIPVLYVDDEELSQSHAIERFLAREFGLDGETSLDKGKVDMWIESADELIRRISDNIIESDDREKQETEKTKIQTKILPSVFKAVEKTLSTNKSGFVVGNKLTVADLAFVSIRDWLQSAWADDGLALMNSYPHLSAHVSKIAALPALAVWIKNRPETAF